MGEYDRSSKWLIQHHGNALLWLAGVRGITAWRPLQAEVVQPAQLPDGLLEAHVAGDDEARLYVVEIGTRAEERLRRQVYRDALLVLLDRGEVPEVVVVILRPGGAARPASEVLLRSRGGGTHVEVGWRVVELWEVPADDLLATGDPGVVPWVPLCRFEDPPETVIRRCRAVIDEAPEPEERINLLAVTQVLTSLRYNDPGLLAILGGDQVMIESPLLDRLVTEAEARGKADMVLTVLGERFGAVPEDLAAQVRAIRRAEMLRALGGAAVRCNGLDDFRASLAALTRRDA